MCPAIICWATTFLLPVVLRNNYATGNQLNGMDVNATGLQIDHNGIIGNKQLGLRVFTSTVSITENNIFGNGTRGVTVASKVTRPL